VSFSLRFIKIFLALAALTSVLLVALVSHFVQPRPSASNQAAALHPLRIVRSPQAPKSVRPVYPAAEPALSPSQPLARPAVAQHKA